MAGTPSGHHPSKACLHMSTCSGDYEGKEMDEAVRTTPSEPQRSVSPGGAR